MTRRARKLTAKKVAAIQARRARGERISDIARNEGLSVGSVSTAIRTAPMSPAPAVESAPDGASNETPVTPEELHRFLSAQIRSLRSDVERSADPSARAGANRNLLVATQLLSRLLPPSPGDPDGVYVTGEAMREAAARARSRWHDLADRLAEVSKSPLRDSIRTLLREREEDT
jgi:hypothetical protein